MSEVALALGSNQGDRLAYLEQAIHLLKRSISELEFSFVYETPPLLPDTATTSWNLPFLNMALKGRCQLTPQKLLEELQSIESQLGREKNEKWAPRPIDIDILLWENKKIQTRDLQIPHAEMENRAFVLDPLKDIMPQYRKAARKHPQHSPLWMAILNITPDSFSDGGEHESLDHIAFFLNTIETSAHILDLGAESTRPGAAVLSAKEEWQRLRPVMCYLRERYQDKIVKPCISVDTRHAFVAERAIEMGASIINDVSGASDEGMLEVVSKSSCDYVLMHSLSIPADPDVHLDSDTSATQKVCEWMKDKLTVLEGMGISRERVILDPGVGFGKTALQSLDLLKNISYFDSFDCRVLVGHSRKSFMNSFCKQSFSDRDVESIGVSLQMAQSGVDILRVHNPLVHTRAFLAFNHVRRVP